MQIGILTGLAFSFDSYSPILCFKQTNQYLICSASNIDDICLGSLEEEMVQGKPWLDFLRPEEDWLEL